MNPTPSDPAGGWRSFDEPVTVTFDAAAHGPRPLALRWRGSLWRVVGESLHWSTWRALPVAPRHPDDHPPTRAFTADFWRFRAQSTPVSPVLHFEVRRAGSGWRLVRLGTTFDLPGDGAATRPGPLPAGGPARRAPARAGGVGGQD
jgi:hypothetical protein